jgi:N-acetylmuramoyl-L-alanine amidase
MIAPKLPRFLIHAIWPKRNLIAEESRQPRTLSLVAIVMLSLGAAGCASFPQPGTPESRRGDEIVAAGRFFHTGTRVILWMDPGGYDAYRVQRRFAPLDKSGWDASHAADPELAPNRYGLRLAGLTTNEIEAVRGGGWSLPQLQKVVDQFVIHFDAAGTSRRCFATLQDLRGLSVHFMCDVDGTIYQTLDLKECAWHATIANSRSVGIEMANIGAYDVGASDSLEDWYRIGADGRTRLNLPDAFGAAGVWTPGFVGHPARANPVHGTVQGRELVQYDFTPQQYAALIKLTATLCKIFPRIECQFPADAHGEVIPHKLTDAEWKNFHGVLGHYHIQTDKVDPGPAFQWNYLIEGASSILRRENGAPLLTPRRRDLLRQ